MARNEPDPQAARGDDVYQPTHSDAGNRPSGELDPENALATDPLDDPATPGYSPPEHPEGVDRHGTTQREQREGEPLDERLAQEVPEARPPAADGAVPAEEAAVHVESGAERTEEEVDE
ncbi:hypothetical protein ACH4ZU_07100 [Streptomyces sp. NPDC020472]|uniref:hypothetical protein n=1 Tax=Streptomyces sp. NPDC020472 TaxID=3365075 RepID=UPI00379A25FA